MNLTILLLIFLGSSVSLFDRYMPGDFFSKKVFAEMKQLTQNKKAEFIVIRGFFDEKNSLSVYPLYIVGDTRLEAPAGQGPYTVELQNTTGSVLSSYSFDSEKLSVIKKDGSEIEIDSRQFAFEIPFNGLAKKLVIKKGSKVLWNVTRTHKSPVVLIKKPIEGETIKGKVNIEWTGFDADGDTLFYLLESSTDGGFAWEPLSALFKETNMILNASTLPASRNIILAVVCTDGFNTTRSKVRVVTGNTLNP